MKSWQVSSYPEHLETIATILNRDQFPTNIPDDEYAKAAFDLIKVADGDKEALKRVSDFIQNQHYHRKSEAERFNLFRERTYTWVQWASNWTQRKVD